MCNFGYGKKYLLDLLDLNGFKCQLSKSFGLNHFDQLPPESLGKFSEF